MLKRSYPALLFWNPRFAVEKGFTLHHLFLLVSVLGLTVAAVAASSPGRPADPSLFVEIYLKDVLLIQLFVLAGWFISGLRQQPGRLAEYRFLNSLPVPETGLFFRLLALDLRNHAWVPLALAASYFGLLQLAPLSAILRLGLLALFGFVLAVVLVAGIHLLFLRAGKPTRRWDFITKFNPAILLLGIVLAGMLQISLTLNAGSVIVSRFWILTLIFTLASGGVAYISKRSFSLLHRAGHWYRVTHSRTSRPFFLRSSFAGIANPFLVKNLLRAIRSSSVASGSMLTIVFLATAYLMAMNNRNPADALAVLRWLLLLFIAAYSYNLMNRLRPEEESPGIVFSVPARPRQLYLAVVLPALLWLVLVVSVLAVWLTARLDVPGHVWQFWLNGCLSAAYWIVVASNFGLAYYPDLTLSKQRFIRWTLATVVLYGAFYKFKPAVLFIMFVLACLPLRRIRFYQVPSQAA